MTNGANILGQQLGLILQFRNSIAFQDSSGTL